MAEEKKTYKFVCIVCGYEVEVDTPELPEDYVCPVCGVSLSSSRSNSQAHDLQQHIALSKGPGRISRPGSF